MSVKPEEEILEIRVYREVLEEEGLIVQTGSKLQVSIIEKNETPSE